MHTIIRDGMQHDSKLLQFKSKKTEWLLLLSLPFSNKFYEVLRGIP